MWELVFIPLTHPIRGRSGTFAPSLTAQVSGKEAPHLGRKETLLPLHRAALLISVISL
ncbi:hypothetical protein KSB_40180 [Ktedonobacter robiniae]|uniref:Uncharacterized protein n=1 Tax=Ktedonobacter robiniae TaxID=2778365 RepID=A0ABQ3URX2_9CHLR|nr:hypothetical protein KSB_40180 [Ktedonobacter robiniae]